MKEAAVRIRRGGRKNSSHCAASMPLRTGCGINTPKSSLHTCPHCRRAFPFNVSLQLHIKDHLVQNTFKCSLCPTGFSSKYQLSVHLRRHAGLALFKCDQCSVKFINASNLQRHIRNGVCHKKEEQRGGNARDSKSIKVFDVHNLSRDRKMQTSSAQDDLGILVRTNWQSCEACNETFTSSEDYSHHEDLHKTGNIFKCRNCAKNFCTLPRLSGETLGEDEKYWRNKCMLCGATCDSDNDLFMHLRRHLDNNEDLYCKQCQNNRIHSESRGNNSAPCDGNKTMDDITTEQYHESVPDACLSSVASSSNCVTSPASSLTTASNDSPLTFSQVSPFQTTTYFTTNLSNVSNFVGALYQQPDITNVQQRVLQPVYNVVHAGSPYSLGGRIDLCADGTLAQTSGVLASAAQGVFVVNPVMRHPSSTQSIPCAAQMLSSIPGESRGPVSSCVPTAWPMNVTASSAASCMSLATTCCSLPSATPAAPIVSCLNVNTQALLTTSVNCCTNQTFCCSPAPQL